MFFGGRLPILISLGIPREHAAGHLPVCCGVKAVFHGS